MDLSVLLPGGAGVAILGWIGWLLHKKWLRDMVIGAASRASGITYEYLAARAHGVSSDQARRDAFAAAMDYMRASVGKQIDTLGLSGPLIENLVRGQLGALLAVDPTVSVAAKLWPDPPPIPAQAPAPATTPVL
jgi:hypothetical protein